MSQPVIYERERHVVILTLNRPQKRNTLTDADMIEGLLSAFERMTNDSLVRVAIVTGAGSSFSSGGNIREMGELAAHSPEEIRQWYQTGIQRIPLALAALDVPIIAAVNGPAVGAGAHLAYGCDIRIASERASFTEKFVKLAILPADGGVWNLIRLVGGSKAAEMALTGDPISADEALACGLVSRVVPQERLLDEARVLAGRIAINPGSILRRTKRLLRQAQEGTLEALLQQSLEMQVLAHKTANHQEAVQAFLEKRAPCFPEE